MAGATLTGLARLRAAAKNSAAGFQTTWQHEEAFRMEAVLLVLALPLSFWVGDSAAERLLLVGVVFLLLIVELLNTAVETVVDRIGLEHNELSGRAKDQGSAAVFLATIITVVTWLTLLIF